MGCVIAITALTIPRVLMVLIFLFSDWFSRGFQTTIWPLLGFFFMPYTTLVYMGSILNNGTLSGAWLALFIIAIITDAGHWGGGGRAVRHRRRR